MHRVDQQCDCDVEYVPSTSTSGSSSRMRMYSSAAFVSSGCQRVFSRYNSLQPKQQAAASVIAACIARILRRLWARLWPDSYGTSVLARRNLILNASCQSPRRPLRGVFRSRMNSSLIRVNGSHEPVVIGSQGDSEC